MFIQLGQFKVFSRGIENKKRTEIAKDLMVNVYSLNQVKKGIYC